jgi:hypothetical protein
VLTDCVGLEGIGEAATLIVWLWLSVVDVLMDESLEEVEEALVENCTTALKAIEELQKVLPQNEREKVDAVKIDEEDLDNSEDLDVLIHGKILEEARQGKHCLV